ncbi:Fic family protein [Agriterribacter sp.]|uniref:Fic family protein n=1 Tax=Agriterribacter sp. TaxID=2821509 RepID=UPI002CA291A8|nr:Fic family protein [Agriterribacter sp.]HRO45339.1 Fic family protein [Agriterribacter sp.]HRQ17100.1 Fic family protein [Agriterribacter sp.]
MLHLEKYKAGIFRKGIDYQYFVPELINHDWVWNQPELNALLEKAAIRMGELNSFSRFVPNVNLFIQLHVTREAVVSSRIEGTQTNINEALLPESEITPERRNDWKEVNNYVKALNYAINGLSELPLSGRLLRHTHKVLLSSVRGEQKLPGEYRTSQNWIGGASLKDAVFIPPHHELVPELMSDLEHFLHNEHLQVPDLIRIALAHYQFETIHPFLDGNGRIGRLLITLFLVDKKILEKPLLYLSAFFERNKALYYDNLTRVRTHSDLLQWVKYFLVGIEQTATEAMNKLQQAIQIKGQMEQHIQQHYGRRTTAALTLVRHLLQHPVIAIDEAATVTGLSYKAANDLVSLLTKHGWMTEITGQSRNRIFIFDKYLNAFGNE